MVRPVAVPLAQGHQLSFPVKGQQRLVAAPGGPARAALQAGGSSDAPTKAVLPRSQLWQGQAAGVDSLDGFVAGGAPAPAAGTGAAEPAREGGVTLGRQRVMALAQRLKLAAMNKV